MRAISPQRFTFGFETDPFLDGYLYRYDVIRGAVHLSRHAAGQMKSASIREQPLKAANHKEKQPIREKYFTKRRNTV